MKFLNSLDILGSGGTLLDVQGSQGQLFSVTDSLSGSIFAVSDISGVPILDVNSSGTSYFSGNVGIGTTSPTRKLHVVGGSTYAALLDSDQDYTLGLARSGTEEWWLKTYTDGRFAIHENGVGDKVTIKAGGNVGIGTTSPAYKLDINGDFRVKDGSSAIAFNEYSNGATIWLDGSNGDFAGGDYFNISAYGTTDLAFGYAAGTKITMKSDGKLGIGTTSPTHLLTLETASSPGLKIKDTTQGATLLAFSQDSNSHVGTFSSHPLVFDTNSTERIRITSAGDVGIGTSAPGDKLTVNGNISLENSGTPIFTIRDTGNAGGGGAAGIIRFKNTAGDAIGIGYTGNDTTTSDLLISTNAASTYGGYLGLDANAITDPSSIILDPKTSVIINGDVVIGEHRIINLPSFNMGGGGVTDEYLVVCKQAPSGGGVDASGIQGRISFSRGSDGSFNNSHYMDINIQMSLDSGSVNTLDVTQFELYRDSANPFFSQLEEIDIDGTKYVALKARSSGGGSDNHNYFEGSISDDSDTNILSRVRASDSTVTVTAPQPTGFPITPYITKNQDGNVGIGVTNPSKKLEVAGSAEVVGTLYVEAANNNIRLLDTNDSTVSFSVGVNGIFQIRDVAAATTPFSIQKTAPGNSMIIKADGAITLGEYGAGTLVSDASGNITVSSGGGAGGPYLPLAGGTMTGSVRLNDNVQLQIGSSNDAYITHNGTHTYFVSGVGDLYLQSNNDDIVIQAYDDLFLYTNNGVDAIIARGGAAVELYHNNVKKFETTSTGVEVTGKITNLTAGTGNLDAVNVQQLNNATTGTLIYKGTWSAAPTTTSVLDGAVSSAGTIVIDAVNPGISVGATITGTGISGTVTVSNIAADGITIAISSAQTIADGVTLTFTTVGGTPDLSQASRKVTGHYYICETAGAVTPNGAGTTPNEWAVGDWATFSDLTTDAWQKIDNSSVLSGAGTGGKVPVWSGTGTSLTLADAPITVSGNNATFAGDVTLSSGALSITGDGSNAATLTESSAGIFTIAAVDDIRLDATGDISLDAGGDDIRLKVSGTEYAKFNNSSSNLNIFSSIQDKAIKFIGNDNGTEITALTLNMADGGDATFAGNITATANYSAGNSKIIYKAQRSGGAVAGDWSYDDATTDMSLGTSTAHSFSLKTGNTRALTLDTSQNATFTGNVTLSSTAPILYLANTTSSTGKTWRFSSAANGNAYITQDGVIDAITLSHTSGNATFAGNVTATNILTVAGAATGSPYLQFTQGGSQKAYIQYADSGDSFELQSDNQFVVRTGGSTAALTINSSQNATFANNVYADKGVFSDGMTVTGDMSSFETTLTNNEDWQNSPISILERGNVQGTETADKYSPNLNFHWGGVVSKSLWMGYNGHLNWGEYSSTGIPAADGRINATFFGGELLGTINTATTGATQTAGDNSTKIATTAYADAAAAAGGGNFLPLAGGTMTGNVIFPGEEANSFKIAFTGASASSGLSTVDQSGAGLYIGANSRVNNSGVVVFHDTLLPSSGIYFDGWNGDDMEFYTGSSGNPTKRLTIEAGGDAIFTGNVSLADSKKLIFGAGDDLQIFHNGSNSHIETSNTSVGDFFVTARGTNHDLYLEAADNIYIRPQGNENGIVVVGNGGVTLYHNNVAKLETTSTGVTVTGDIKVDSALLSHQENTDVDTGTETVASVLIATYTAAFFDFVIKNGTNLRAGTVFACHDGTNVVYTETSTNDLGDTSDVTLSVDISGTDMRLRATVTSDDWSVKSLIRAI